MSSPHGCGSVCVCGGGGSTGAVGRKQVVCLIADTHPELLT